jgi:hypothetical protein
MIVVATVLAALTASIVAVPYLLVRHLHRQRARHLSIRTSAAHVARVAT